MGVRLLGDGDVAGEILERLRQRMRREEDVRGPAGHETEAQVNLLGDPQLRNLDEEGAVIGEDMGAFDGQDVVPDQA